MTVTPEEIDKVGLIREAYRIEGISAPECRSIFLDWALKLPAGTDEKSAIRLMIATYGSDPRHPMSVVLAEGLGAAQRTGRRGGRASRHPSA